MVFLLTKKSMDLQIFFFSIFYKWLHSLQGKFVGLEACSNKYVLVDELFKRSSLDCVIIEMLTKFLTKFELLPFKIII